MVFAKKILVERLSAAREICLVSKPVFFWQIPLTSMVYFYKISSNNIPYCEITVYHNISEVNRCIKKLKTGKSAGPDLISNEIIKFSGICTCKSITKLFNLILDSGK